MRTFSKTEKILCICTAAVCYTNTCAICALKFILNALFYLNFIRFNQDKLRVEFYKGFMEALEKDGDNLDTSTLGKRFILPSSFTGRPRQMAQIFFDAMPVATEYRKPDFFMTITTNPEWPEIKRELLPHQNPCDRPDLIARVFRMKLRLLLDYIQKHLTLRKTVGKINTIEFQKRGLPHCHILIIVDQDCKISLEELYNLIWAEILGPELYPQLYKTVSTCMIHGPCGTINPKSPCR